MQVPSPPGPHVPSVPTPELGFASPARRPMQWAALQLEGAAAGSRGLSLSMPGTCLPHLDWSQWGGTSCLCFD